MMSRSIEITWAFLATLCMFSTTMVSGHSQLMCAQYDKTTQQCVGALPRNSGYTYTAEDYVYTGGEICQYPWANPITSYYDNGASCPDWAPCPDPMGTYAPGESFTIMWYARNHAEADESPGNIYLYMSPVESLNQGSDVSVTTMKENLICSGPFSNCEGPNGNTVHCTLDCTMPANTPAGYYTFWWYWPWADTNVNYATCADIQVTGSASGSSSTSSSSSSSTSSSTGLKTGSASGSASGAASSSSSSSSSSSTSSSTSSSSSSAKGTTGKKATTTTTTTGKKTTTTTTTGKKTTTTTTTTSTTGPAVHTTGTSAAAPQTTTTTTTTTSTSSSASGSCTDRDMICSTSETYQMCVNGAWGQSQSCQVGLTCHPSDNVIYCY